MQRAIAAWLAGFLLMPSRPSADKVEFLNERHATIRGEQARVRLRVEGQVKQLALA